MSQYDFPQTNGALFKNDYKEKPNQPDFKGDLEISGEQVREIIAMSKAGLQPKLRLAAWARQPKGGGNTYFYLSAQAVPPQGQQGGQPAQQRPVRDVKDFNNIKPSDIPDFSVGSSQPKKATIDIPDDDIPF